MTRSALARRAFFAVPLLAVGAACVGASPALARPTPAAQPDICHSRYLIACVEAPPSGGVNRGTPGWGRQGMPGQGMPGRGMSGRDGQPNWEGDWGGIPRNHGPFPPVRRTPQPGPF